LTDIANMINGHILKKLPELLIKHFDAPTIVCYASHITTSCQNPGFDAE